VRILLDTNALYPDPKLERAPARLLLAAASNDELELVVPELVILEGAAVFRRRLKELARDVAGAERGYRTLGVTFEQEVPNADQEAAEYERALRARLLEVGARTPAPPDMPHVDVARRAIQRRRPFDAKGNGYRDTLIWLQALSEAADDQVVLVTQDKAFRADKGMEALAGELCDELEAAGLPRDRVRLSSHLAETVRDVVEPSAQAVTRLHALLGEEEFRSSIYEAVNESLQFKEVDAPREDPDLHALDVAEVQIDGVLEVDDLEIDDAYVDDDRLAFNVGGRLDAEVSLYPLKSQIASVDLPGVSIVDADWNEWLVLASTIVTFSFEGFGSYDPESREVELVDVWLVY